MRIATIIVGIDNWQKYTLPLVESIGRHEPNCQVFVVDNNSAEPYPMRDGVRTSRLCYSNAINRGKSAVDEVYGPFDWYIVLSNDVLCTGPFAHLLEQQDGEAVIGPLLKNAHGFDYIEGWAVFVPRKIWDAVGGWDERFLGSDYEDVAFSTAARQKGFWLEQVDLPFVHLDQRQRYHVVDDFAGKNAHNQALFLREYAAVTA